MRCQQVFCCLDTTATGEQKIYGSFPKLFTAIFLSLYMAFRVQIGARYQNHANTTRNDFKLPRWHQNEHCQTSSRSELYSGPCDPHYELLVAWGQYHNSYAARSL